jgi:hypothetical protein
MPDPVTNPIRLAAGDETSSSVPLRGPRSSRASFEALDAQADRPARLQMIVALLLVLVLVAIPLYLWRRPRAESIPVTAAVVDGGVLPAVTGAVVTSGDDKLVVGEPKTLSCHDPGPKRTNPEQCDHVADLAKAFTKAIEETAVCVPRDAGGGTILYVADVLFKKKLVTVATPKEGRTMKNPKVASGCEKAVRNRLAALPFETIKHEHAHYRVSITATYPGVAKP